MHVRAARSDAMPSVRPSWHTPLSEIHTPPGRGQLRQMLPVMPHRDIARGSAHYCDVLGFHIIPQDDLGVRIAIP